MSRAWWTSTCIVLILLLQLVKGGIDSSIPNKDESQVEHVLVEPGPIVDHPYTSSLGSSSNGNISCECQLFIQSWKTSNIIRLPSGIGPIEQTNSSLVHNDDFQNDCLAICKKKIPAQSEENSAIWNKVYRHACRALLINEYQVRQKLQQNSRTKNSIAAMPSSGPIKGCLQAYFRSSGAHVWVPMGPDYRKILACSQHRHQRRLRRSLAKNGAAGGPNSIDAQNVVAPDPDQLSPPPPNEQIDQTKRPLVVNTSPLRMALKQFGLFTPYVDGVLRMVEQVGLRELLDQFQLGGYIDRYHRIYDDYTEEVDVGHCFAEYLIYNVFNNRFAAGKIQQQSDPSTVASTSRGLEDDVMGMAMNVATKFLSSDNAPELLSTLFSLMPSKSSSSPVEKTQQPEHQQESIPQVQDLAMTIARYYLRNYFSTLAGSTVRVDEADPVNNPESLADMIEQVSRPVFLSVFGVVPGVPASGKLDHLLLMASKERPDNSLIAKSPEIEWRNKLQSDANAANAIDDQPLNVKTGNAFFDFGNMIFGTFQRANDATHGLYCAKQYFVNKMWDRFRGGMRRMMRTIPKSG